MKRANLSLIVCFFLLLFVFPDSFALNINLNEYYPLNIADYWLYKKKVVEDKGVMELTEKVAVEEDDSLEGQALKTLKYTWLNNSDEMLEYIGVDEEGVKIYKTKEGDSVTFYNPAALLFPSTILEKKCSMNLKTEEYLIVDGKTKEGEPEDYGDEKWNIEYEGRENITVPAGEFIDCIKLKVSFYGEYQEKGRINATMIIWFAKGVGKVKQLSEFVVDSKEAIFEVFNEEYELAYAKIGENFYGKNLEEF